MQKLRTFFISLFRSSTDPAYYADILKAPASFSWKYFFFFNFLASFVIAAFVAVPVARFDLNQMIDEVASTYPSDLEIVFEDGQVSINQELPYVVPFPDELEDMDEDIPMALVTFTSNEEFLGVPKFDQYNSLAVVTETTMYFREEGNSSEIRSYNLSEFESDERFEITPSTVQMIKEDFMELPFIKQKWYVPVIALGVLVFAFPGIVFVRLLTLTIYTAITWLVAKMFIKSRQFSYGDLFQVGIHSLTPVILVAWVLAALSIFQLEGWLYFGAYLAWTLFVLVKVGEETTVETASPARTKSTVKKAVAKKTKAKQKKSAAK